MDYTGFTVIISRNGGFGKRLEEKRGLGKERDRGLSYPPPVQPGGHAVRAVRGAVVSGVVLEPHQGPIPVKGGGIEKQLSRVKRKQERPVRKTAKLSFLLVFYPIYEISYS